MRKIAKRTGSDLLFDTINTCLIVIYIIICLYPVYYTLIYSLSTPSLASNAYFFPKGFSFENYFAIFRKNDIINASFISASRSILGALLTTAISSFIAFLLTRKLMPLRSFFYRYFIISMYLNFGLIPYYIIMVGLGFKNNYLLYIIPGAINVFYILLSKVYIESLPVSIFESAEIDGAGIMMTFTKLAIPMSIPILTTIFIFSSVGQWNSWMDNLLLVRSPKLKTLQLLLMEYLNQAQGIASSVNAQTDFDALKKQKVSPAAIRCAITIIAVIPIALEYPFLQKYYTGGIMLGSIKG